MHEDSGPAHRRPAHRRMPVERRSITHKAHIHSPDGEFTFYIIAGMYEDGTLGEVFVRGIGKEGSTIQGLLDAWACQFSIGLQHGASLGMMARKFAHMKFPPYGTTDDPSVPECDSPIDYIVRWLDSFAGLRR